MNREEIVAALRCISTPGDHCVHCESCQFWRWEKLTEAQKLIIGEDGWEVCDVDAIGLAAADLIENQQNHIAALMKANDSLKDAIARRDKQIEDMKQGMAQLTKAVAVKEERDGTADKIQQRNHA